MRRRWVVLLAITCIAAGVAYSRGWATQAMTLADGRRFEVLNFDRHTSYIVGPDGSRRTEHYFWVRYYATSREPAAMLAEGRSIGPALFPIADSLGFVALELAPSWPVLSRHFPLAVVSSNLRFERDSAGTWREASP